ncbi:nitrilase-related carbon-nitrogen hydrolase [Streptomyces sp. L7]
MRASLIQIAVEEGESVENRRVRVGALVREQAGADLVVLPELWTTGAFAYELFGSEAEPLEGPTYEAMAKAASDAGVWLHAGSIPEQDPEGPLYNTSLVFSPLRRTGRRLPQDPPLRLRQGARAVLMGAGARTGDGPPPETTLGLATCYDLRFPELFRGLVDAGAETLVLPAGWPERRRSHWTLLAQARAVENQSFVLACGTAGTHAGVPQAGHSIVVDPWGEVLAEAGAGEEVLTVEFDPARVAVTRERQFPALKDRVLGLQPPRRALTGRTGRPGPRPHSNAPSWPWTAAWAEQNRPRPWRSLPGIRRAARRPPQCSSRYSPGTSRCSGRSSSARAHGCCSGRSCARNATARAYYARVGHDTVSGGSWSTARPRRVLATMLVAWVPVTVFIWLVGRTQDDPTAGGPARCSARWPSWAATSGTA